MMTSDRTEKLKLVFTLKNSDAPDEPKPQSQGLKLEPKQSSLSARVAAQTVIGILQENGFGLDFFDGQRALSATAFMTSIEKKGFWGKVETSDFIFQYGIAGRFNHSFVTIEERAPNTAGNWDLWVTRFIAEEGFLQAWISDIEYSRWQNVKDPDEYKFAGRSIDKLPMKFNGLPPPIGGMEIDISRNPGREVLRSGFIEAVGSVMWLSDAFWKRVGFGKKQTLYSIDWLQVSALAPEISKIRAAEHCFSDQGDHEMEDRIRQFLYS